MRDGRDVSGAVARSLAGRPLPARTFYSSWRPLGSGFGFVELVARRATTGRSRTTCGSDPVLRVLLGGQGLHLARKRSESSASR